MPNLDLLLIEDTAADATLFMEQIQQQYGSDVRIVWKKTLHEAKAYLQAETVDQIWLDRILPDFNASNFASEVAALKKFLPSEGKDELYLLTASPPPTVAAQAQAAKVDIVSKDDLMPVGESQIVAMVTRLLEKRSSGATVRVQEEARLVRIEMKLEQVIDAVSATKELKQAVEQLRVETGLMREHINKVPELASQVTTIQKAVGDRGQLELKRLDMRQAIILSLVTVLGSLGIAWLTKTGGDKPAAAPSPNPAVRPGK